MSQFPDLSKIREVAKKHWSELIPLNQSYPDMILGILEGYFAFPNHDIVCPIIANYLLANSVLANIAPILFFTGKEGSGKSHTAILASKIQDQPIFSSASTYASIRNQITNNRYKTYLLDERDENGMPRTTTLEQNIMMIWDDVDPSLLLDDKQLIRILKNGYNRATSAITISSETRGKNLEFDCFGLKILGSVTNIMLNPKFREVARRSLIIETKPVSEIEPILLDDTYRYIDFEGFVPLNPSDYDWSGINQGYRHIWSQRETLERFVEARDTINSLTKRRNLYGDTSFVALTKDIVAMGYAVELWDRFDDCFKAWDDFYGLSRYNLRFDKAQYKTVMANYLAKHCHQIDEFNDRFGGTRPYEIKKSMLVTTLNESVERGDLPSMINEATINEIMLELGWYDKYGIYARKA